MQFHSCPLGGIYCVKHAGAFNSKNFAYVVKEREKSDEIKRWSNVVEEEGQTKDVTANYLNLCAQI